VEYRRLGRSGLKLSALSLGSWVTFGKQVDTPAAVALLSQALDAGVNFFDNAEGYEAGASEIIMGQALARLAPPRDTYAVSSKVFWGGDQPLQLGLSAKHVRDACDAALRRLGVDYLDLFFCHRPDIDTPIEETVRAMHQLILQGKVLYWGTSEWSAQQITEAYAVAAAHHLTPPTMEQPQYNLFNRERIEDEYQPLFERYGLGTTTWSPLASGILTGKYNDGFPSDSRLNLSGYEWLKKLWTGARGEARLSQVRELTALAKDMGISMTHLAIAWCLREPSVSTVILGASRPQQLEDNLASLNALKHLTPDVLERIESIIDNRPPPPQRFGQ